MPSLCASATALDTLPRHSNVKRPSTALNRLQLKKQGYQRQQEQFGLGFSPKSNLQRLRSKRPSRGSASNDLPLASSDLCNEPRQGDRNAFSDGETGVGSDSEDDMNEKKMIHLLADSRPSSASPTKSMTRYRAQQIKKPVPSSPETNRTPKKRPVPSMQAKSRIVTTAMISKPSNFKHTGHVGAAAYKAMQPADGEQLRQQLSEVAAALKMVDDESFSLIKSKPSARSGSAIEAPLVAAPDCQAQPPASAEVKVKETPTGNTALKRSPTKRKPVPGPRKLEVLYDEFKTSSEKKPASPPVESHAEPIFTRKLLDERGALVDKPLPTIRANGKRLVPGPTGDYITDTANGRWVNNLNEITNALKAQGVDGNEDNDEFEELHDGLKRADLILSRIGAI